MLREIPDLAPRIGFLCGSNGGVGDVGDLNCVDANDCSTRACVRTTTPTFCSGPCCKRSECGTAGNMVCIYDLALGIRGCKFPSAPTGNIPIGEPCGTDQDCQSSQCVNFNQFGKLCTEPCCLDADCGNSDKLSCSPVASQQKTVLLCVPRQSSVN